MNSTTLKAAVLAAALALPQAAAAAVVYDEAVNGDAATLTPPVVNLGIGQNDILGSMTLSRDMNVAEDFDGFRLVVAQGMSISAIFMSAVHRDSTSGRSDSLFWSFQSVGPNTPFTFYTQFLTVPTNGFVSAFADDLPVGPGDYLLSTFGFGFATGAETFRIIDYTIRLTVVPSPIPLPAGLPLLAGALGLLALAARRRRTA